MRKNTMLGLGAMALIIVSVFLPMLSLGGISVGLFDGGDRTGKEVGILIIVLACLMGLFSFLANRKHLFSIGTFIFAALLALISMKWFNDAADSGASFGAGLIMYLIGSGLGIVSSIMGFMKK